jgi:hypothetical protein
MVPASSDGCEEEIVARCVEGESVMVQRQSDDDDDDFDVKF